MKDKKEARAKLQIIFSVIIFCVVLNVQLYTMINWQKEYMVLAIFTILLLICLYFIINGLFTLNSLNNEKREEKFDNILKSEKASYLLLKKYFEEINNKLDTLENTSKVPTEEIVNTQKGIAKVVINRSRENAEALMNSNDQLLDRINEFEERMDTNKELIIEGQKNSVVSSVSDIADKQQKIIESIKDMEIRLSQAIMNTPVQVNANVEIPTGGIAISKSENSFDRNENNISEEVNGYGSFENLKTEEPIIKDSVIEDLEIAEDPIIEEPEIAEDPIIEEPEIAEDSIIEEPEITEDPIIEEPEITEDPIIEEPEIADNPAIEDTDTVDDATDDSAGPGIDLSGDPNRPLTADEIAALIASM